LIAGVSGLHEKKYSIKQKQETNGTPKVYQDSPNPKCW